ncbi:MAG: acyl-CoA desaturase [Cyanobacteria bacterium P01_A01_bin.17]
MSNSQPKVAFAQRSEFRQALRQRVDSYFSSNNIKPNDNPAMYFKSAVIYSWVLGSWAFVLWGPSNIPLKILGCIALGFGLAGFGMSVGHDANHGSYSKNPLVNRFFSYTHDFIGVSSFLWRFRHNKLHHIYTNLKGLDVEIQGDGAVRLSPNENRRWHHQYQQYFIWFLYPLIPFYWFLGDTRRFIFSGSYLGHPIPRPKASDIFDFIVPRIVSFAFFFVIPAWQGYSFIEIFVGLSISHMVYGLIVVSIFMLAHVVESVDYPDIDYSTNKVDDEWAILQVKTSADFAPDNAFLNWYLGGLNYQTIHHLFPDVCHIHYPKLAPIVAEVCEEYGIQYNVYDTFGSAIASNYRWLRRLGQPVEIPAAVA